MLFGSNIRVKHWCENRFLEETLGVFTGTSAFLLLDAAESTCFTLSPILTRGVKGIPTAAFDEALVAPLLDRLTGAFDSSTTFGSKSGSLSTFGASRISWLSGSSLRVGFGVIFGPCFGFRVFAFFNGVLRLVESSFLCSSMSVVWIRMSLFG